jgi:serine/threonine protein kinase/tetratricopeptide (TPR) repeat protein
MKLSTDTSAKPLTDHTDSIGVELGPWYIQHAFARDDSSTLFRVRHRHSSMPAVLKVMTGPHASDDDFRARFEHQLRSVVRLNHPGVIDIFDYGTLEDWDTGQQTTDLPDSGPFFVMELARHGGLHQRNELPTWPVTRGIIASILDTLAHAHARDIHHRHLKPSNILFGRDASQQLRVKLGDFGLASFDLLHVDASLDDASITEYRTYMAPEQFRPNWLEYGAWTDMYNLGVVAWELLCNNPPFTGESTDALARQHAQEDLPSFDPVYEVPAETEQWLERMLAKEPADRFRYAADALRQLPAFGSDEEFAGLRLLDDPSSDTHPESEEDLATYPTLGAAAYSTDWSVEIPKEFKPVVSFDQLREEQKKVGETGAGPIPEPPNLDPPENWRPPENNGALPPARRHELTDAGLELANLREYPVVGRGHLRDEIWDLFLDTLSTSDRHRIALSGSLGIGKSRLAQWARQRAQELGFAQGIKVQWPKNGRDSDATGLSRMLRTVLNTDGADSDAAAERIERWFERHPSADTGEGATIAPLIDDTPLTNRTKHTLTHVVAAVISWLVIDPPIRYRRVRLHTPDQKAAVAARFIERMAARRPVILQLDDPHTDEAHAFLRELRTIQQPVLDIVTADTSRLEADNLLQERLENVCDKQLDVGPLEKTQQKFLLSRLLSLSPGLTDEIARQTGGNPRLAVDTVGSWASQQFLQSGVEGIELAESADPQISDNVSETVRTHLEPILDDEPESMVRATELGAVGGTRIDRRDWEDVCHLANLPFPEGLIDTLAREHILGVQDQTWNFVNTLARQHLIHRAQRGDRLADFHSVWADICKQRDAEPARIADHLIQSGRKREALEPLVNAMNLAGWQDDFTVAIRCLNQLEQLVDELDLPDDHPAAIEYHLGRAREIFAVRRNQADRLHHLDKALAGAKLLGSDKLIGDALAQQSRTGERSNEHYESFDFDATIQQALELLDPVDHPDRWASAIGIYTMHLIFRRGEPERAFDFIDGVLDTYSDQLLPRQNVTGLRSKGRAAFSMGDMDKTHEVARQGIEYTHKHNLTEPELSFYNMAATVQFERGNLDHAERLIRETLKLSRSEPKAEHSMFELTLADILIEQGRSREAFEHLNQIPSVVTDRIASTYPWMYRLMLATAACQLQFWDEARPYLTKLVDQELTDQDMTREVARLMRRLRDALDPFPDATLKQSVIELIDNHTDQQ